MPTQVYNQIKFKIFQFNNQKQKNSNTSKSHHLLMMILSVKFNFESLHQKLWWMRNFNVGKIIYEIIQIHDYFSCFFESA